ncbi:MAG: outer membrane beta-barrel protein [Bdellovibrionales bacterium]|nr:outer membrane beta-barrel protein [Bdellovibrionales bacterium]
MFKSQSIRLIAGSLLATAIVGSAVADMVYDDEKSMSAAPTKVEVKNIINSPNAPAPIAASAADTVSTPPVVVETQKIQKQSEKAREKRGFQESVNNELVLQKLEDKRLKQEEKLTAEINKKFTLEDEEAPAGTAAPVMKEEVVVKPITETPGATMEMSAAPKADAAPAKPIVQDQIMNYQSSTNMSVAPAASVKPDGEKASKTGISIIPKAGLSTISNTGMTISPKYMTGVGIGFEASDYVGVEIGYAYSENGVRLDSTNTGAYYGYQPTNELMFKNNTFDVAMKLYAASTEAKVRPYIAGGAGYSVGYINYDQQQQQAYGYYYGYTNPSSDYTLKQFQAMLGAGLDIKLASNISLGAAYKFYKPLSSTESEEGLAYGYFYGQPLTQVDPNKQALRGTIRDSNINVFQVSATVTF